MLFWFLYPKQRYEIFQSRSPFLEKSLHNLEFHVLEKQKEPAFGLALLLIPDDDRLKMDCGAMAQQIRML